jgi:hypothetical protein
MFQTIRHTQELMAWLGQGQVQEFTMLEGETEEFCESSCEYFRCLYDDYLLKGHKQSFAPVGLLRINAEITCCIFACFPLSLSSAELEPSGLRLNLFTSRSTRWQLFPTIRHSMTWRAVSIWTRPKR